VASHARVVEVFDYARTIARSPKDGVYPLA